MSNGGQGQRVEASSRSERRSVRIWCDVGGFHAIL